MTTPAKPTITAAFRQAQEAVVAAREALDNEEALICAELRQYRQTLEMTQEQVSDLIGLSRAQVANIEGGRGASVEALLAYAAVVGCRFVLQPVGDET